MGDTSRFHAAGLRRQTFCSGDAWVLVLAYPVRIGVLGDVQELLRVEDDKGAAALARQLGKCHAAGTARRKGRARRPLAVQPAVRRHTSGTFGRKWISPNVRRNARLAEKAARDGRSLCSLQHTMCVESRYVCSLATTPSSASPLNIACRRGAMISSCSGQRARPSTRAACLLICDLTAEV